MSYLKFQEAIDECGNCEKNVLLGNGFSRAYDNNAFNYQNLVEASNLPQKLKGLFELFKTNDYELIINHLTNLANIFNKKHISQELLGAAELIRRDLARTISNKHPKSQKEIPIIRKEATLKFLKHFKNIFTLNYDLLLYWLIVYNRKECKNYWGNRKDGFSKHSNKDCIWLHNPNSNVFYLHGGLHLFHDERNIFKIKYDNENRVPLLQQIKAYINDGVSPLVITEGSSEDKEFWINQNNYLQYCYNKLSEIEGCLFIHGHSLDDKDQHIFDAITANKKIDKIFISIYNPKINKKDMLKKAKLRFAEAEDDILSKIKFYDASTANLWKQ